MFFDSLQIAFLSLHEERNSSVRKLLVTAANQISEMASCQDFNGKFLWIFWRKEGCSNNGCFAKYLWSVKGASEWPFFSNDQLTFVTCDDDALQKGPFKTTTKIYEEKRYLAIVYKSVVHCSHCNSLLEICTPVIPLRICTTMRSVIMILKGSWRIKFAERCDCPQRRISIRACSATRRCLFVHKFSTFSRVHRCSTSLCGEENFVETTWVFNYHLLSKAAVSCDWVGTQRAIVIKYFSFA